MTMQDDILIEKFFREGLNDAESDVLRERMTDKTFVDQFQLHKQLFESIDDEKWSFAKRVDHDKILEYQQLFEQEDIRELKNTLQKYSKDHSSRDQKHYLWRWTGFAVAAIGLLLIGLSIFKSSQTSSLELYSDYLDKGQLTYTVVRADQTSDELDQAQQLFFAEKYEEALPLIQKQIDRPTADVPALYLMKGVSFTELGDYDQAATTFDTLINSNYLDAQKGYWYKALMYLKMDDRDKAKELFLKIEKEQLYNANQAAKILESLE